MTKLQDLMDIFLQPGEYFVADAEYQVRTMLGSCVSITLWHPPSRIGAMSHFLLPTRGHDVSEVQELDGRYGDEALELMRQELLRAGVRLSQCQAKIFGGGNMFPAHTRNESTHVGRKNGEAARKLLQQHGIPIVSESLFGIGHRQIIFDVSNGDVWAYQVQLSTDEARAHGVEL
jgi:chemotaxis protein CheD